MKKDLFLNSKYNFIYDQLMKYEEFPTKNTGMDNYIKFSDTEFYYKKTWDDYSKGWVENDQNFWVGNDFLHRLSQLWPLTVNFYIKYNKPDGNFEHSNCTFGNEQTGYLANLGPSIGKGFNEQTSLKTCPQNRKTSHGSPFEVNGKYAFWGRCNIPYVT
ncbi:hypothetical protein SNEBB_006230, partial [Seison nebaliae]